VGLSGWNTVAYSINIGSVLRFLADRAPILPSASLTI
jgi:hypothetical protein